MCTNGDFICLRRLLDCTKCGYWSKERPFDKTLLEFEERPLKLEEESSNINDWPKDYFGEF